MSKRQHNNKDIILCSERNKIHGRTREKYSKKKIVLLNLPDHKIMKTVQN